MFPPTRTESTLTSNTFLDTTARMPFFQVPTYTLSTVTSARAAPSLLNGSDYWPAAAAAPFEQLGTHFSELSLSTPSHPNNSLATAKEPHHAGRTSIEAIDEQKLSENINFPAIPEAPRIDNINIQAFEDDASDQSINLTSSSEESRLCIHDMDDQN